MTEVPPGEEPWYCNLCTEAMENEVAAYALEQAIKTEFETEVTSSEITEEIADAYETNHMPNSEDQYEANESMSEDQLEAQSAIETAFNLTTEMEDMELKMDENDQDSIQLEAEVDGAVADRYVLEPAKEFMDGEYTEEVTDTEYGE